MLLAIGQGTKNLQDYTEIADFKTFSVIGNQGDTLDTLKVRLHDPLAQLTITAEDDLIALNENDPTGWPTVNLLMNGGLEGGYDSQGIPGSWGAQGSVTAAGVSLSASSGSAPAPRYGSTCMKLSATNVAASTSFGLFQNVPLPTNELGQTLSAQPYYFSFAYYYTSGLIGVGNIQMSVKWLNVNNQLVGSSSSLFPYVNPNGSDANRWNSAYKSCLAPAGAVSAQVALLVTLNSGAPASNSFAVYFDGAQFEYATFGAYRTLMPTPRLQNTQMVSHSGAGAPAVDNWTPSDTTAAASYSVVTAPSIYGWAQRVTINSTATHSHGYGINQGYQDIPISLYGSYTAALQYQVTTALPAGSYVRLRIDYFDSTGTYYGGPTAAGGAGQGVNGVWFTLTTSFGAGTPNPIPQGIGQMYLQVVAEIVTAASGATSGAVVFGSVSVVSAGVLQSTLAEVNALGAGCYPAAFCDTTQPGVYVDQGESGLSYRHARLFGGYVRKLDADFAAGPERAYDIDATEYGVLLAEAPANLVIRNQQDYDAIQSVCQYAQNQGFLRGLDFTTFVARIAVVYAMAFSWITTRDALTRIANQTVAAFWVDPYKRLHYQPALAVNAPFALSDQPDGVKTFPFSQFHHTLDSTQTITTPIVEGSTQLSAPASNTFTGVTVALNQTIPSGAIVSSIAVAALPAAIPAGSVVQVGAAAGNPRATLSANAPVGATSLSVNAFQSNVAINIGDTVATCGFVLNGGSQITQIDSCTVGGVQKTVGQASTNQYSQGYDALIDPQPALLQFNIPQTNGQAVVVVFRYNAPVIVRLHSPRAESTTGSVRRRIHRHTVQQEINSMETAIDRADADLTQSQKAKPIGRLRVVYPPCPITALLSQGQAISITHRAAGLSAVLFQIQRVTTTWGGSGYLRQDLELGYYRPDFTIRMAQANREIDLAQAAQLDAGTVISDVLEADDGWTLGDSITAIVNNVGVWGSSTHATPSTWGGTYVWT